MPKSNDKPSDFTREINQEKQYTGVRFQQGRVVTDPDLNESAEINKEREKTRTAIKPVVRKRK